MHTSVFIMDRLNELKGISRFFFARDAQELREAYSIVVGNDNDAPEVDNWNEVEYCFNKLFVGPKALLAPPFSSIYIDQDKTKLMGATTELIRYLYEMIGLVSPWKNKIPDDHIALEIDALWKIETALIRVKSEEMMALRDYLLQHLRLWLPQFNSKVRSVENVHPVIIFVMEKLIKYIFFSDEQLNINNWQKEVCSNEKDE